MQSSLCEQLLIGHLDADRTVIATQFASSGRKDEVPFPLRMIIADALKYESDAVILIHNHPSGIAQPSQNDIQQTRLLERAFFPLQIILEEHLIVTISDRFSFREAGLL
jgi:DNA repair protein RadC